MSEHTCAVDGRENCYRCAELAENPDRLRAALPADQHKEAGE